MLGGAHAGASRPGRIGVLALLLTAAATTVTACSGAGPARSGAVKPGHHVAGQDLRWLQETHQGDIAETETAPLALDMGGSAAIRRTASVMLADRSVFDQKLLKIDQSLGVRPVQHMTLVESGVFDQLDLERGHRFDNDFTGSAMTLEQNQITQTETEIAHGSDPAAVALAKQALPMEHKELALLRSAAPTG